MDPKGSSDPARIACVDLPAFPLQLLVCHHPDWRDAPAVVVDEDKPQGLILWSNERARAFRVLPGMRYAAALSLARDLRADVIEPSRITEHVASLTETLQRLTPSVEPKRDEPGVFWLDASGLERLFGSLDAWQNAVGEALTTGGFTATVVVGFTRTGSYAVAKGLASHDRKAHVFESAADERRAAARVPLARLGIQPRVRDALARLGTTTLGQFLRLPRGGIRRRFGAEAYTLHRLAAGDLDVPLTPAPHQEPLREELLLDYPEEDLVRIVLTVETLLDALLTRIAARNESLTCVTVALGFELAGERFTETLRPAAPTRDRKQVLQLIALRLGSRFAADPPRSGVVEIALEGEGISPEDDQLDLFAETPRRDLAAAGRALARLRAELGEGAVMTARLREGHLPEARITWEPMHAVPEPDPTYAHVTLDADTHEGARAGSDERPLVRRLFDRPVPLPPRPRHEPDGWLVAGLSSGAVRESCGPYVVSGGWWMRRIERRYHYVHTTCGRWLWIYEDVGRRRWFMQGTVE